MSNEPQSEVNHTQIDVASPGGAQNQSHEGLLPSVSHLRETDINGLPISRELGSGGFARTILSEKDGRRVVIKVSKNSTDKTDKWFFRGTQILDRLKNKTPFVPHGQGEGVAVLNGQEHPYYIMDYIEGRSLSDAINRKELDLNETFKVLRGISYGVDDLLPFLPDLKPDNIILRKGSNIPVLVDFDWVNLQGRPPLEHLTPAYCGPDIANGFWDRTPIGSETNTWAVAAMAYRMLSGRNFFSNLEGDEIATIYRSRQKYNEHLKKQLLDVDIPDEAKAIFAEELSFNPSDRSPTTGEFVRKLQDVYFPKREKPGLVHQLLRPERHANVKSGDVASHRKKRTGRSRVQRPVRV